MGLSQYYTTLAHVTPRGCPHTLGCACTMGAHHHAEVPQAQVILPKLHHHAEGLVPRRRSKSQRRVSAYRCRSVTPITQHKFVGRPAPFPNPPSLVPLPQPQLGRPNSSDVNPPINLAIL